MEIPIQNVYYLLCYAWDKVEEKDEVEANSLEQANVLNLLSKVLTQGTAKLIRRGLDRGYVNKNEEIKGIKGKFDLANSIKKLSLYRASAYCSFDELEYSVLHNCILKSMLYILMRAKDLDEAIRDDAMLLYRHFNEIEDIKLSKRSFGNVQLHRNNYHYGFLMNICELLYDCLLPEEKAGRYKFKNFLDDDTAMNIIFENFVRNFYKLEQRNFKVRREDILWNMITDNADDLRFLPKMQTDITLESKEKKIIIDTKFYRNALLKNYEKEKLISSNLYQMFAYLNNVEAKSENINRSCEGILLYPTVQKELSLKYEFAGHKLRIETVDLSADWKEIHKGLIGLIS